MKLRRRNTILMAALAAALAAPALLLLYSDEGMEGEGLCPLRRLCGLPCPACGLTRSLGALYRGRIVESLEWHPFGALFAVLGALLLVLLARDTLRGRAGAADRLLRSRTLWGCIAAGVALHYLWVLAGQLI